MQILILTGAGTKIVWNVFVSGAGYWQQAYQRQIGHTWPLKGPQARDCDQLNVWMWPPVDLSTVHCTFIPSSLYHTTVQFRLDCYHPSCVWVVRCCFSSILLWLKKKNDSSQGRNRQRPRLWNPMLINCRVFDFVRHTGLYWFSFLCVCACVCVSECDSKKPGARKCNIVFH